MNNVKVAYCYGPYTLEKQIFASNLLGIVKNRYNYRILFKIQGEYSLFPISFIKEFILPNGKIIEICRHY